MPSSRRKKFLKCIRGEIKGRKFKDAAAVRKALGKAEKKCSKKER